MVTNKQGNVTPEGVELLNSFMLLSNIVGVPSLDVVRVIDIAEQSFISKSTDAIYNTGIYPVAPVSGLQERTVGQMFKIYRKGTFHEDMNAWYDKNQSIKDSLKGKANEELLTYLNWYIREKLGGDGKGEFISELRSSLEEGDIVLTESFYSDLIAKEYSLAKQSKLLDESKEIKLSDIYNIIRDDQRNYRQEASLSNARANQIQSEIDSISRDRTIKARSKKSQINKLKKELEDVSDVSVKGLASSTLSAEANRKINDYVNEMLDVAVDDLINQITSLNRPRQEGNVLSTAKAAFSKQEGVVPLEILYKHIIPNNLFSDATTSASNKAGYIASKEFLMKNPKLVESIKARYGIADSRHIYDGIGSDGERDFLYRYIQDLLILKTDDPEYDLSQTMFFESFKRLYDSYIRTDHYGDLKTADHQNAWRSFINLGVRFQSAKASFLSVLQDFTEGGSLIMTNTNFFDHKAWNDLRVSLKESYNYAKYGGDPNKDNFNYWLSFTSGRKSRSFAKLHIGDQGDPNQSVAVGNRASSSIGAKAIRIFDYNSQMLDTVSGYGYGLSSVVRQAGSRVLARNTTRALSKYLYIQHSLNNGKLPTDKQLLKMNLSFSENKAIGAIRHHTNDIAKLSSSMKVLLENGRLINPKTNKVINSFDEMKDGMAFMVMPQDVGATMKMDLDVQEKQRLVETQEEALDTITYLSKDGEYDFLSMLESFKDAESSLKATLLANKKALNILRNVVTDEDIDDVANVKKYTICCIFNSFYY